MKANISKSFFKIEEKDTKLNFQMVVGGCKVLLVLQ